MARLYLLCGIPFSGKTTLAKEIVRKLGYTILDTPGVYFRKCLTNNSTYPRIVAFVIRIQGPELGWVFVIKSAIVRIESNRGSRVFCKLLASIN